MLKHKKGKFQQSSSEESSDIEEIVPQAKSKYVFTKANGKSISSNAESLSAQILSESLKEVNFYGSLHQGKDDLVDLSKIFAGQKNMIAGHS